jgi:hypothetical protein
LVEVEKGGKGGSNCLRKWSRSQTIRTAARLPFEVAIPETSEPPIYQRIAAEGDRLDRLGLSSAKIAAALGVSGPTARKAIRWYRATSEPPKERGQRPRTL